MVSLLALLLAVAEAPAAECPHPAPQHVEARLARLEVDGVHYRVTGPGRVEVERVLRACGQVDAIPALREWRRQRRAVNTWAVVGVVTGGWGWIGLAWAGPRARRAADALEVALLE